MDILKVEDDQVKKIQMAMNIVLDEKQAIRFQIVLELKKFSMNKIEHDNFC